MRSIRARLMPNDTAESLYFSQSCNFNMQLIAAIVKAYNFLKYGIYGQVGFFGKKLEWFQLNPTTYFEAD